MHQVLIYCFPLILIAFEWGLKMVMNIPDSSFAGPALAAAALSCLIPLTIPKRIKVDVPNHPDVIVTSPKDYHLVGFIWLLSFVYLFAWGYTCFLSVQTPLQKIWKLDLSLAIGIGVYILSLLLTLLKEKL